MAAMDYPFKSLMAIITQRIAVSKLKSDLLKLEYSLNSIKNNKLEYFINNESVNSIGVNILLRLQLHQLDEEIKFVKNEYNKTSDTQKHNINLVSTSTISLIRNYRFLNVIISVMGIIRSLLINNYKNKVKKQIRTIKKSDLFDETWYLYRYPDVAREGIDPVLHYILHGANEGRDPSPEFSTAYYLHFYPDVSNAGINPLIHYIDYGIKEGRNIAPTWHGNLKD